MKKLIKKTISNIKNVLQKMKILSKLKNTTGLIYWWASVVIVAHFCHITSWHILGIQFMKSKTASLGMRSHALIITCWWSSKLLGVIPRDLICPKCSRQSQIFSNSIQVDCAGQTIWNFASLAKNCWPPLRIENEHFNRHTWNFL